MRKLAAAAFLLLSTLDLHAAITGRVLTEEGAPVAGARVRVLRIESSDEFWQRALSEAPDPVALAMVETGDDGSFSIDVKPERHVTVVVEKPPRAALLSASDGDRRTIVLETKTRRGRVTAQGKPLAGARVIASRVWSTTTDSDGRYEISESVVRTGGDLFVNAPGYVVSSPFRREARPRANALPDVELQRGVSVRGQVVAPDGTTPAPNAILEINGIPLARSAADGTFVIERAPASWKKITARASGLIAATSRGNAPGYLLTLRPASTIAGTLRSSTDDAPVAGARILINSIATEPADTQRWVVTDAKGAFNTGGLTAGTWRLFASRGGFSGRPTEVRVGEGERVERRIGVHPVSFLSGRVIDVQKKPVAMAELEGFGERTYTNPDGTFEVAFPGFLRGATASVNVRKRGYAMTVVGPYELEPGERKKDVQVVLGRGVAIRLKVVDAGGNGVKGVSLSIALVDQDLERSGMNFLCRECAPDDNGFLEVNLAPGTYEFTAAGDGIATKRLRQEVTRDDSLLTISVERGATIQGSVVAADGSTSLPDDLYVAVKGGRGAGTPVEGGAFTITDVPAGKVTLLVQKFSSGRPVTGTEVEVTAPATGIVLKAPALFRVEGRVTDRATKQPVQEFSISQRASLGSSYSSGNRKTYQSDDGTFVLDDLSSSATDLMITAPGYAMATLSNVNVEETREPLQVQLDPGGTISGRVTRGDRPLDGVFVQAMVAAMMRGGGGPSANTDGDGAFVLEGLAAGEYTLQVFGRGITNVRKAVEVSVGRETRIEIEVPQGTTITGRVIDETGQPVSRARVYTRTAGGSSSMMADTDADGAFKIEDSAANAVSLVAEKSGYLQTTIENFNPAVGSGTTLTLRRGGTISGQVRGLSESEMAMVRINAGGMNMRTGTRPDPSGQFTLRGVTDGRVQVIAQVEGPDRRTAETTVEVTNGSASPVTVDFGAGFAVSGRVTRAGAPIRMAQVMFEPAKRTGMMRQMRGEVNAEGAYEVRLTEPGEYRILVETGGTGGVEVGTTSFSGPTNYDIALEGAPLRGRVVDASNHQPIAGVVVTVSRMSGGRGGMSGGRGAMSGMTDADGRFSFEIVPSGRYQMRTSKQRYASESEEIEVRDAGTAEVELRIRQGQRAVLRIVDAETRRTLENVQIHVTDGSKRVVSSGEAFREDDGAFRLWLAPGRYTARIWVPGFVATTVEITVPGPDTPVTMARAGRVVVQGNKPGAVRARLLDLTTGKTLMQNSIPPGVFESVAAGSYRVELLDDKQATIGTYSVVVAPGQTAIVPVE